MHTQSELYKIDDLIEGLLRAESLADVSKILQEHISKLGFDRFAYWMTRNPEGEKCSVYFNTYPADWMKYYTITKKAADDLVLHYAVRQLRPYSWQNVKNNYDLTVAQQAVFLEGADAGLQSGATVPLFGPGQAKAIFSVSNNEKEEAFQKLFLEIRHLLQLTATYAHEKILSLKAHEPRLETALLTAREIDILTWVSRGKTNWEIGKIIQVSEATVKRHVDNICTKLGVNNRPHAVSKACTEGLIYP